MHIAHLARAENELLTSPLEDELRFIFREHVGGAVVLLRQLLLPLHHFAGEANDHIVLIGLNRDGPERRAFDLHSLILVLFPSIPPQAKPWFCLASVAVFLFASRRSAKKLGSVTSSHAPEHRLNVRLISERHDLHL